MIEEKVIIALDALSEEEALRLASSLRGKVWGFKVNDLLINCGISIVSKLKDYGNVFADPKLHDIPNTVGNAVQRLEDAGADLITVHASGGRKMIEAAARNALSAKILAVTLLTSLNAEDALYLYSKSPQGAVVSLASLAARSGASGIVCSPEELPLVSGKEEYAHLIKVIPGIRPAWHSKSDDQARFKTPKEAIELGADLMVIGRPVIEHADPVEAVRLIAEELRG